MRILLHEFVTGGGWHAVDASLPAGSLLAEGQAMRAALLGGLAAARAPVLEALVLHDARLPRPESPAAATLCPVESAAHERALLGELAPRVDGVLLIAPECGGLLAERCRWVEQAGGRLLGPASGFVALASDKSRTAERLRAQGVPVPLGCELGADDPLPVDFPYPAVVKPTDGAGSIGVVRVEGPDDARARSSCPPPLVSSRRRLERLAPGLPASIALLTGPQGSIVLPAMRQILSDDGRFSYLGGEGPLAETLHARAAALATAAMAALGPTQGYVGFDLVLGDDPGGGQDFVIEVNPRCTTSVVGYAMLCTGPFLPALVAAALGANVPAMRWRSTFVRFTAASLLPPQ